jgi:hypothetical protein
MRSVTSVRLQFEHHLEVRPRKGETECAYLLDAYITPWNKQREIKGLPSRNSQNDAGRRANDINTILV